MKEIFKKVTLKGFERYSVSNYGNVRNAYTNCEDDKKNLKEQLSEEYYNAVMAVWEV